MADILNTNAYFINELTLPVDNINWQSYIDEHEPIILRKILGYELYKEFITELAGTPSATWTNLRDGAEYTDSSGYLQKYDGIYSIIAEYVFCAIVADKQNYTTDSGVKIGGTENAENYNPRYKQKYAQNDMVCRISVMNDFINATNTETADTYDNYLPETIVKGNIFNI